MVFARAIVDGEDRGITCFLVPQDADGYVGRQIHGKLGLRSGDTAEIALEGSASVTTPSSARSAAA
jgi:alkylation response protein AidB-like acyl-CoA dehydrogenase